MSRKLDRSRPLWEMTVIEGLPFGRVALMPKMHHALVDGMAAVDIGTVLLDPSPEPLDIPPPDEPWSPRPYDRRRHLARLSLTPAVQARELLLKGAQRALVPNPMRTAGDLVRATELLTELARARPAAPMTPLNHPIGPNRRYAMERVGLAAFKAAAKSAGGTINDAILATVTGALRGWLLGRSESMSGLKHVRTVVPVSVSDRDLETTSLGSPIIAYFVDLPVGETSPVVRLHQVSYAFQAHKETGRGVAANRLAGIAGFAPSTFHAIGARVAADETRRGFQLSVTNVPGPQSPLYAAGARMVETYPVHPLLPGHALAIGVTSYDGHVYFGITADRDQVPDADVLGQCVPEALAELLDTIGGRARAPRGRRTKTTSKRTTRQGR
jgi:diacylglycerol O-acyltransferase